jgi:aminoglycoside 2'-N-acetyltransferase I
LLDRAFGRGGEAFTDDDWAHALGGLHVVLDEAGEILAHASVVERALEIDGQPLRTGYVEAVAVEPGRQGQGHGTVVMQAVGEHIRAGLELGALGTGEHDFYERLGWERWRGPAFVRLPEGLRRTLDDEGFILVLRTQTSPALDLADPISCEWRRGDAW